MGNYLSFNRNIKQEGLIFNLNTFNQTSAVIGIDYNSSKEDIIIPRNINFNTQDFIVKSIEKYAFKDCQTIKTIQLPPDSELHTIEFQAFKNSSLEEIKIPQHVAKICEEAFFNCKQLKKVEFAENSELEVIEKGAFSFTAIDSIRVPKKVTQIGRSAFYSCHYLRNVEYEEDSRLKIIENEVFYDTKIEKITIPSQVKRICTNSFAVCVHLQCVECALHSELETIEGSAFIFSSIERISIPSSVKELQDGWCSETLKLRKISVFENGQKNISYFDDKYIVGKSDNKSDEYDVLIFARRNIIYAKIPPFIKKIGPFAFDCSCVIYVTIPNQVVEICCHAFNMCRKLKRVDFLDDPQLQTIGRYAFNLSGLESFIVPPHVNQIYEYAFNNCKRLQIIDNGDNYHVNIDRIEIKESKNANVMTHANKKEIKMYFDDFL